MAHKIKKPKLLAKGYGSCACGGRYSLGYVNGQARFEHTLPTCKEWDAIENTDDAVTYSQRNRLRKKN